MQLSYWEIGLQGRLHRCGEWNCGTTCCFKNTRESKILVLEKECYHMVRALRMLVLPALEYFKLLMT
jgi:hypothetical protein